MTSNNQLIVNDFITALETHDNISLSDMKKLLTKSYNKINKKSKKQEGGEEKPKRAPTAYNIFMKEKMSELKLADPTKKGKELMSEAASLWKEHKETNQ